MAKINVLEKQVAELIAAGEVVERPASVIKELAENSVDAGASAITVEIKNGGITFMRVTDNGCGIEREDVPKAFLRHATSKVKNQEDLSEIGTLGFRGEALASVCAMAKVELLTRTSEEPSGTRYVIEGGEVILLDDAGCPMGTTILVRDLFYNTPARMKFLKKDVVEANAIAAVLDRIALSHPEVSVRFIRDGKEELHTPGDNRLQSAIYAVYGRDFADGLIEADYEYEHIRVTGFISKPAFSRPNRSMQEFFLNGRYVKSRTAMAAIEEAYKGSIMVGKFPACVLHISIVPQAVDVNVHPAKIEVRFVNERPVFDAVYHAVKSALSKGDEPKTVPAATVQKILKPVFEKKEQTVLPNMERKPEYPEKKPVQAPILRDSGIKPAENVPKVEKLAPVLQELPTEKPQPQPASKSLRVCGEIFDTYILAQYGEDELMMIDKHAAHERLLYEKIKSETAVSMQELLTPVPVTLGREEYAAVLENLDVLQGLGFEAEDYGAGAILLRSVPIYLSAGEAASALSETAGYLARSKNELVTEKFEWLCHNIACRAAVKAGNKTSFEELCALAKRLTEHPEIRYCPHGRPISVILKKRDLDKQFGRL